MEFGMLVEANLQSGSKMITPHQRYKEMLEEAVACDKAGFDVFGASEQHFIAPTCVISAPETLLAAVAAITKNIKIRPATILLPFQHPVHVAERLATLDLISDGRVEFGSGKGNSFYTIEGFGLSPDELEDRWFESLQIILKALSGKPFSHTGKYWSVPERTLAPAPLQQPHPPLWYAAISPKSHELAGRLGLGLMTLTVGVDLDKLAERVQIYKKAIQRPEPIGQTVLDKVSCFVQLHCSDTTEQAEEDCKKPFMDYLQSVVDLYEHKLKASGTKVDFTETRKKINWDYLNNSDQIVVGDPDTVIRKLEHYREAGVDEVFIRAEGIEHDKVMKSIELLGKYVIPHFKKKTQ